MNAFSETMKIMSAAIDREACSTYSGKCWECAHYLKGWCRVDYPEPPKPVNGDCGCEKWRAF